MNPLSKLFELISVENPTTFKTEELGRYFLLALEDESNLYPFSIVDIE